MTLLTDSEKVEFLITALDNHITKLPSENSFRYYLESVLGFLKTENPISQKVAYSNAELFIDNLGHDLANQITFKRAIGALIASFNKVGFYEPMDAAALILEFEELLKQMPLEEAETLYRERWEVYGSDN